MQLNNVDEPTQEHDTVYLNDEPSQGRGLHGGQGGKHGGGHHDGHQGGPRGGRGGQHGGCGGRKIFKLFISAALWFLLVAPFMCMMRRVTFLRYKIHKINKKCSAA